MSRPMSAGMTVDEIERRAKAVLADDWLPENHREKVLARFVLLVMPVVRAAQLVIVTRHGIVVNEGGLQLGSETAMARLIDAMAAMERAAMREGES